MNEELRRTMFVETCRRKQSERVGFVFKEMLLSRRYRHRRVKARRRRRRTSKAEVVSARIRSVPLKKSADEKGREGTGESEDFGVVGKEEEGYGE